MDNIFMTFFDLFMNLWEVSGELLQPLISFVTNFAGVMIPILTNFATFLLNTVNGIIDFIEAIIKFFTGNANIAGGI